MQLRQVAGAFVIHTAFNGNVCKLEFDLLQRCGFQACRRVEQCDQSSWCVACHNAKTYFVGSELLVLQNEQASSFQIRVQ